MTITFLQILHQLPLKIICGIKHLRFVQGGLLILGARAVLASCKNKTDRLSRWAQSVAERRGYWKAVVAVAAKNARMAWAMLSKGEAFKPMS